MAFRRSLHVGGSYGRAQAIINWALDNWQEFDGWCCVKGVDPIELSSLRFYNLALYYLKDGRDEEGLKELEQELLRADSFKHPLHLLGSEYSKAPTKKAPESKAVQQGFTPSWWRGDTANAKIAMNLMKQLPG